MQTNEYDLEAAIRTHLIALTSQWPRMRLKSPASRLFTQSFILAQIKENIKAPRHWPLCREFPGTGEFPAQRVSYAENISIWWRHHEHDVYHHNVENKENHSRRAGHFGFYRFCLMFIATRLDVIMIVSLWNLTGISAALLPRCLSIFRATGTV